MSFLIFLNSLHSILEIIWFNWDYLTETSALGSSWFTTTSQGCSIFIKRTFIIWEALMLIRSLTSTCLASTSFCSKKILKLRKSIDKKLFDLTYYGRSFIISFLHKTGSCFWVFLFIIIWTIFLTFSWSTYFPWVSHRMSWFWSSIFILFASLG